MERCSSPCSVVVSTSDFESEDPGSTPGRDFHFSQTGKDGTTRGIKISPPGFEPGTWGCLRHCLQSLALPTELQRGCDCWCGRAIESYTCIHCDTMRTVIPSPVKVAMSLICTRLRRTREGDYSVIPAIEKAVADTRKDHGLWRHITRCGDNARYHARVV